MKYQFLSDIVIKDHGKVKEIPGGIEEIILLVEDGEPRGNTVSMDCISSNQHARDFDTNHCNGQVFVTCLKIYSLGCRSLYLQSKNVVEEQDSNCA